jgi:hypothetical protein
MSQQDEISKRWFDPSSVRVTFANGAPRYFDDEAVIGLSGAFSNSHVKVELSQSAFVMTVEHFAVEKMRRDINFDINKDKWFVYNSKIRLRPEYAGQRLAVRSIAMQARAAGALGFDRLSTYAVGNRQTALSRLPEDRWAGYWVWPRIGFDGDIPEATRKLLPLKFQGFQRLSQLLETDEGEYQWMLHGEDVAVQFDPRPNSISWEIFSRYTSKHGIRI